MREAVGYLGMASPGSNSTMSAGIKGNRAGHTSIQFTLDRYCHLWTDDISDQPITRTIERSLLG